MIIYNVRYTYHGEPASEHFLKEKAARERVKELQQDEVAKDIVIERDKTMRVGADLILRMLNGEPYVIKRETVWTPGRKDRNE